MKKQHTEEKSKSVPSREPFIRTFLETPTLARGKDVQPMHLEDVVRGGMPTVCLGGLKNKTNWFNGYEHTYLDRDIRDLSRIGDVIPFHRLLHLVALRASGILNISDLSRDAHLTAATVSSYLSIMEVSCVVYRLAPYLRNRSSRLIKSPEMYLGDSGLACYLAGTEGISDDPLRGALVETYVAQNLVGILDAGWPQAHLFFWNIQGRHEVDFIIEAGKKCMAIEVRAAARWGKDDLTGLRTFIAATPHCAAGILAYTGTSPVSMGSKLWAIPLSMLLS